MLILLFDIALKCILYIPRVMSTLYGGIAQMGECLTGSQKVTGSSPVISTNLCHNNICKELLFFGFAITKL